MAFEGSYPGGLRFSIVESASGKGRTPALCSGRGSLLFGAEGSIGAREILRVPLAKMAPLGLLGEIFAR